MIGDVVRARLGHRCAQRLWSAGEPVAASAAQDAAITRYARTCPRRPGPVLEFAVIVSAGAGYAAAAADLARAALLYRQVINNLTPVRAGQSRDGLLVNALLGLGNCRRLSGDYAGAHRFLGAAVELARGSQLDSAVLAAAWNALGILAKDTGRYEEAAQHYRAAVATAVGGGAENLPLAATLQHNLAGLAHVQGNFAEGEAPARRAVDLRRRSDTAGETDVAADETVLGAILLGQGRLGEAEALFRHAIAVWSAHFSTDHYEVAVNLHNLAAVEQQRGQVAAAEESLHRALMIKRRILGDVHAEIAALLNDLATLNANRGRYHDAERGYAEAVTLFLATLGANHPSTKTCQRNRAVNARQLVGVTGCTLEPRKATQAAPN